MRTAILSLLAAALAFGVCGCQREIAEGPDAPVVRKAERQKSRVQVWAQTCRRCHNIRPPETYSTAEWEVAVSHMRIFGTISARDIRRIEEFLKDDN